VDLRELLTGAVRSGSWRLGGGLLTLGGMSESGEPHTRAEEVALLRQRIEESGLSDRQFALQVLRRDDRTIRRWLAGDNPIPQVVMDFLREPVAAPWP